MDAKGIAIIIVGGRSKESLRLKTWCWLERGRPIDMHFHLKSSGGGELGGIRGKGPGNEKSNLSASLQM